MAISSDYIDYEFPSCSSDPTDAAQDSVDFGQFLSFLESENGDLTCLQEGHGRRVINDSPCLPLTPPCVCSAYDDVKPTQHCHPAPGTKFKIFKEVSYLYTNYPEERLPLPLITSLLNEQTQAKPYCASAVTFVPCKRSHNITYIGYLVFGSGPDLCTLTVGGVTAQVNTEELSIPASFAEWSRGHAPLSLHSLEAYALPSKIRNIHFERAQHKVVLCCHSNYHVTLFEVCQASPPPDCSVLQCMGVYSSDSIIVDTRLSPYIAHEFLMLNDAGHLSLTKKNGDIVSIPSHDHHFILCCYGSQPRSLLLATPNELFHLDIRDGISSVQLVPIFCRLKVTCLSHDIGHPFRVLVATHTTLFLLDLRQPNHHLLAVQHQLTHPPSSLSCLLTHSGNTMVLLTSAKNCESVVICYNGRHSPPYFVLRPHTITTPSEQFHELRGLSFSSLLPLVGWRFASPALGSEIISVDKEKFAAILLTGLGDLFYQRWHYHTQHQSSPTAAGGHNSHSLHVGYNLWLEEASCQQQELSLCMDMPATRTLDMDPLLHYLVTAPKHVCLHCHYVHTRHFPEVNLDQYLTSETTDNCSVSSFDQQRCRFCGNMLKSLSPKQPASIAPLTSGSGLESLREACAVRQPKNELEFSLVNGWTMGGAELQRNLLEAANTPAAVISGQKETNTPAAATGDKVRLRRDNDKNTPILTPTQSAIKTRRIGF